MKVIEWVAYDYDKPEYPQNALGGMGGWFQNGYRFKDYLEEYDESVHPYINAFREAVLEMKLKEGGDWHQNWDGTPKFDDGTVSTFSYRAWGDIMAAIWSTEENKDYNYMDFYMTTIIKDREDV